MEKVFILLMSVFLLPIFGTSQSITDKGDLQIKDDSLEILADEMINALDGEERQNAAMHFIPKLVDALKIPFSFNYHFDSVKQLSVQYPEDSTFRIFSWGITPNNANYRFYGALQMRTQDGSLKLFPFFDNSEFTSNTDTITSNKAWYGAIYYKILTNKYRGKTYYTLFGWHGFSFGTNQKVLDILTFKDKEPVFGAPVFNFQDDSLDRGIKNRFILTYKRDGSAGLNFDPDKNMIVYDHLISLNGHPEDPSTMVPDGTYEGFVWKNGYWVHVSKVYNTISNKPPFPAPIDFKKNILDKEKIDRNP